jgi:hypothetical protein
MSGFLGVAELVIVSHDPGRLVQFYRDAVGLSFAPDGDRWQCQLGATCLVVAAGTPGAPLRMTWAVDDLEAAVASLRARGLEVRRTSAADAWGLCDYHEWSSGFTDPDGNTIGLSAVAPAYRSLDDALERELIARFGDAEEIRAFVARHRDRIINPQWFLPASLAVAEAPTLAAALTRIEEVWR